MPDTEVLALEQTPLAKRTWHYARQPRHYEIAPHSCGHDDAQWSEFDKHLWCAHCEVDFIPDHGGIFSGPIPINTAMLMGVVFDRVIIATGELDRFSVKTLNWESEGGPMADADAEAQPTPA